MATIWFEGIDELNTVTAKLQAAKGGVGAKGAQVVRKFGLAVEAAAKVFCPVDTGFLKGSISSEIHGDGRHGQIEAEIGAEANYGRYVEQGTRFMAPRAFLGPALDRQTPGFMAACAQVADLDLAGSRAGGGR